MNGRFQEHAKIISSKHEKGKLLVMETKANYLYNNKHSKDTLENASATGHLQFVICDTEWWLEHSYQVWSSCN